MTDLEQAIASEIIGILDQPWNARTGTVVPTTETVALNGGRVDLIATMLYADLADSTVIAMANPEAAARLFRAYLALSARLITARGGETLSPTSSVRSSAGSATTVGRSIFGPNGTFSD